VTRKRIIGWSVFIVECGDGTYFSGMCRDLDKKIEGINNQKGVYFSKHPERVPVELVFSETELVFQEAYAKHKYMQRMNRKQKKRVIGGTWPMGGPWKAYLIRSGQI
jgi:putative endonuclease